MKALLILVAALLCGCQTQHSAVGVPYHPGTTNLVYAIYGKDRNACWREARTIMDEQGYVGLLRWPEFESEPWRGGRCYMMMVEFLADPP